MGYTRYSGSIKNTIISGIREVYEYQYASQVVVGCVFVGILLGRVFVGEILGHGKPKPDPIRSVYISIRFVRYVYRLPL